MQHKTIRTLPWTATAIGALLAFAAPALAQDTHFKIYGGPAYVAPMSDSNVTIGSITDTIESEQQFGWNLGIEGRIGSWFGIELDYAQADQDFSFGGGTIGKARFSPLTATLNFHVVHTTIVDFYLGPSYSYVNWGNIQVNGSGGAVSGGSDIGTENDQTWGASLGLDIGIGKHFAICGGLKYLDTDLKLTSGETADVKPLVARLSAALRF